MSSKPRKSRPQQSQPKTMDLNQLEALWDEHGPAAIETVRIYDPAAYLTAIARLVGGID